MQDDCHTYVSVIIYAQNFYGLLDQFTYNIYVKGDLMVKHSVL